MNATNITIKAERGQMGGKGLCVECDVDTRYGVARITYWGTFDGTMVYMQAWGNDGDDGRHIGYVRREGGSTSVPVEVASMMRKALLS